IIASLRNQSNIPLSLSIDYDLSDPEGNVVFASSAEIDLQPANIFATFNVGSHVQLFNSSGTYSLRILSVGSLQPPMTEAGSISVIRDISIDIEQAVTPSVVIPEASERVRVKIRLEGTEVN